MKIQAIENEITDRMEAHQLTGWTLSWIESTAPVLGRCDYRIKAIILNWKRLSALDEERILGVALHEIAHALVGPNVPGHGAEWLRTARRIGCPEQHCGAKERR